MSTNKEQPTTLAELKARKRSPFKLVSVNGMNYQVRVLDLPTYFAFMDWHETQGAPEENRAGKLSKLVSLCCPVFDKTPPEDLLEPWELVELGVACQRANGMLNEVETVGN